MSLFRTSQGPARELFEKIRGAPESRHVRFDIRSHGKTAERLIIGIGQVHPVLQGKFERFQARRIGRVQAWIFHFCLYLYREHHVDAFGQEGFASEEQGVTARHSDVQLSAVQQELTSPNGAEHFLRRVALDWLKNLRRGKLEAAHQCAVLLNGLTVLQGLESRVRMFPIEQGDVHGVIGPQIAALQKSIEKIEASPTYQAVRTKEGKNLTKEEYESAVERSHLVATFNAMLSHPERDKSIFRQVIDFAEKRPLTIFILGQGHRGGMLRLAKEYLPDDALFVWITPPALWWWGAVLRRMFWAMVLGVTVVGFILWLNL